MTRRRGPRHPTAVTLTMEGDPSQMESIVHVLGIHVTSRPAPGRWQVSVTPAQRSQLEALCRVSEVRVS